MIYIQKASAIDWNSLQNDNVDVHAENINTAIRSLATECIPNKHVRIKPLDLIGFHQLSSATYVNVSELTKEQNALT